MGAPLLLVARLVVALPVAFRVTAAAAAALASALSDHFISEHFQDAAMHRTLRAERDSYAVGDAPQRPWA